MPSPSPRSRSLLTLLLAALVLAVLVWFLRGRIHFDWHALGRELRGVSVGYVLAGVAVIYASYWLRAMRWAVLLAPVRRTRPIEVLGSQFIGFTAVVLVGRLADLVRPYLVARRLALPVASQLAVYSVERAFDLGAAAVLFSFTLAIAPRGLPHHTAYVRAGALSLAATAGIALFAFALRFAGERIAALARRILAPFGETLAGRIAERIIDFREGLRTVSSLREFLVAAALSILLWVAIALAYLLSARSFTADPVLANISFTAMMLLLATSIGGSLVQLPIIGWFTQIALVGAAIDGFFGVRLETATACAAVIFFVLNLDVIPAGLIAARLEGTSLREAVSASKRAEEQAPV